ncbi:hypothetical protein R2A130_2930 [Ahrensia sp. R2A130]|nr:hypothetical protein R2A130_2930 [Ahrensia sp. R2A130]
MICTGHWCRDGATPEPGNGNHDDTGLLRRLGACCETK